MLQADEGADLDKAPADDTEGVGGVNDDWVRTLKVAVAGALIFSWVCLHIVLLVRAVKGFINEKDGDLQGDHTTIYVAIE
eukprot:gene14809-12634_t